MPPSNGNPEPDERTSLLSKDVPETIEPSLGDAITPGMDVNSSSSCSKGDDRDEERGEVEDGVEGNHKVAQKMYLLFPAVSIGVRTPIHRVIMCQTQNLALIIFGFEC